MARKLNKNVVGVLTLLGMALLAIGGVVLLQNMPGQDPAVYAAEAKRLEGQQKFNEAMQTYARAYMKDAAHDPEYLVKAARCAIEDGGIADARKLIQQARMKNAKLRSAAEVSTELEFELAQLFGGTVQWNTVLEEAKKLAEMDEQSPLVYQAMGSAYVKLAEPDNDYAEKGEAALERARELDPTNAKVVELLAAIRWDQAQKKRNDKKPKDADALLEDLNSILKSASEKCAERGDEKAANDLKRDQALYQIIGESPRDGLAALEKLAASEKTSVDSHLLLASIFFGGVPDKLQRDLNKAEQVLKEAMEIDAKNGAVYAALGQVYRAQREQTKDPAEQKAKLKQEAEVYERGLGAVERTRHFRFFRNNQHRIDFYSELCLQDVQRAHETSNAEQKAEALKAAEAWVEKLKQEVDLESTPVRLLTAHILNARGDYVAAIREAEAADRSMKGQRDLRLLVLLGDLYTTQRQWGAARDAYLAASEGRRSGSVPPALYLRLARSYLQIDEAGEAIKLLTLLQPRELQEFMDNDETAIALRIEAYQRLGRPDLVKKEAEKLGRGVAGDELQQIRVLLLQQQNDEAEAKLKAFLEKKPDEVQAVQWLITLFVSTGRSAEAQAFLKSLRERDPKNREWEKLELMIAQQGGELPDEKIVGFLKEEPDEFARSVRLVDFFVSRRQYEEARKYADEAEKLRPEDGDAVDRQFRISILLKDWDRAEKYATKSASLNFDGTEGKLAQGRLAMAKADFEMKAGRADAALAEFRRAIELLSLAVQKFPKNAMAWTYLAEAYGNANRQSEEKETLKQALQIDPTNGYANRALARIAISENDEKSAEMYLRAAAKSLTNDSWVQERLHIIKEKENPRDGIVVREKTREEKPEDVENLVLLARLYGNPKVADFDKASEAYLQALKLVESDAAQKSSNNDLLLAREIAGFYGREDVNRPAEGEALLDKLMKKEEEKPRKALTAVYLGQFFEDQKTVATADRYFRMAVSFDPSPEVLTMAAEFCSRTNQLAQALDFYERVLKSARDNPGFAKTARVRMVAILLTVQDMERAKEQIDEYVKAYPDDPQGMVYEGAYHRMGGDIQKAKEAFDAYLEKNPENALALWQRGQLNTLLGRWELAIADLKKAKLAAKDAFGYQHRIALANALIEAGKGDEAIGELRSILDERPEEAAVAEALVDAYTRISPPRYAEAETLIYTYMRLSPKETRWPRMLGRLGEMAQDWSKAVTGYEKAAEVARDQPEIVRSLFLAYKKANRPQDIIRYGTEKLTSRALAASPEALAALAWAYGRTNDETKCLETYDQALAACGENVVLMVGVVNEMAQALGSEAALARARARADADPENPDRKKVIVHLLFLNKKLDEALQTCQDVGKLGKRVEDSIFAELGEAMILQQMERYPEAKAKYEAALKLDPNQPLALNNLAFLLVDKMDRASEALPYAERAKKLDPNNPNVLDTYGWVLAKKGRLGEALGALLKAAESSREDVSVLYHLGVVHELRGELEEAKARLLAAKAVIGEGQPPELPKINEALQRLQKAGG